MYRSKYLYHYSSTAHNVGKRPCIAFYYLRCIPVKLARKNAICRKNKALRRALKREAVYCFPMVFNYHKYGLLIPYPLVLPVFLCAFLLRCFPELTDLLLTCLFPFYAAISVKASFLDVR